MAVRTICVVGDIAMIPLTKNEYAFVDAEKSHMVAGKNWHLVSTKGKSYAATITPTPNDRRSKTYLHRLITDAPKGLEVDHVNNNGLDNRLDNLRVVTSLQNRQNTYIQKNNVSGASGVFWSHKCKRWFSEVQYMGRKIFIGFFDDVESASHAVVMKKAELFGDLGIE